MNAAYSAVDIAHALGQPRPTPEQIAIIEHPLESVLVVAGAGSGKTETMASRVVWLVTNGLVPPESVLGLTFTRKAAGELAERINRRLRAVREAGLWTHAEGTPDDAGQGGAQAGGSEWGENGVILGEATTVMAPTVSTYNAYAGRLVSEYGLRLGVEPDAGLLGEALAWQLADASVAGYDGPMDAVENSPATITGKVLRLSGQLSEHLRTAGDVEEHLRDMVALIDTVPLAPRKRTLPQAVRDLRSRLVAQGQLLPLVKDYEGRKRRRSVIDFADQVQLAAALARYPAVAHAERRKFHVVLLDEFQDTSEAQMQLLRALFAPRPESGGLGVPVVAVGDPHQSIYGWRGASATTLTRFPAVFASGEANRAPTRPLSTSWRNDEAILDAANVVAAELTRRTAVDVGTLRARPDAGPGRLQVGRWLTAADEAEGVANWIADAWWTPEPAAGEGVRDGEPAVVEVLPAARAGTPGQEGRTRSGRSAAVLCRRRSQFPLVVEALRSKGLPVEVVGLGGLLMVPEITDLVAMIASATDPTRSDLVMRLLAGSACRLGVRDLDLLGEWAKARDRAAQKAEASTPTEFPDRSGLIEAIDDLPHRGWKDRHGRQFSSAGRLRLEWLADAVGQVREAATDSLPELVATAERVLGLEVELLSRPGVTPSSARAHLDAFTEVVTAFAAGAASATPHALLAYLEAAADQERGLDMPAPAAAEGAVNVLTVHAAKGLEWDVVAVPGMTEGGFPSYPHAARVAFIDDSWEVGAPTDKAWLTDLGALPYPLRGDADGLPTLELGGLDSDDALAAIEEFARAGGDHAMIEERRLAYVAFTRAVEALLVSAPVWEAQTTPRRTSRFLEEIAGRALRLHWEPMPEEGAENPAAGESEYAWPVDASGAVATEAARVRRFVTEAGDTPVDLGAYGRDDLSDEIEALLAEWEERARGAGPPVAVVPGYVTGTDLVRLQRDPAGYASELRRPMPSPPADAARAGSAFHTWIEQRYRVGELDLDTGIGVESLLPAADDPFDDLPQTPAEERVEEWKANFLASEWADRTPVAVEFAIETVIDGLPVRGRIDAVFPRAGGGVEIVDWKSGRQPSPDRVEARSRQLALYRVAYADLRGLSEEQVGAAFFYAADGTTVRPDLPGKAELTAWIATIGRPAEGGNRDAG